MFIICHTNQCSYFKTVFVVSISVHAFNQCSNKVCNAKKVIIAFVHGFRVHRIYDRARVRYGSSKKQLRAEGASEGAGAASNSA